MPSKLPDKKEKGVRDFVLLNDITESAFLENIQVRFMDDTIYTYIGDVIVCMNPYKNLNLYGKEYVDAYRGRYYYECPPHLFAVADDAYRDLSQRKRDQCVIISGEYSFFIFHL